MIDFVKGKNPVKKKKKKKKKQKTKGPERYPRARSI